MRFRKRIQTVEIPGLPIAIPSGNCFHLEGEEFSPVPLEDTFEPLLGERNFDGRLPGTELLDLGRHASAHPGMPTRVYMNARRLLVNCGVFGGTAGERSAALHRIGAEVRAKAPELAQLFLHLGPGESPY